MAMLRGGNMKVGPLFKNTVFFFKKKDTFKHMDFNFWKILPLSFPLYF